MSKNDCVAEVNFKIYRELRCHKGKLIGHKDTAEELSEGYVYVFRQIRPDECNGDGTKTRIFETIDLSTQHRTCLPKVMGDYGNHYFFAYSKIKLHISRVENLRVSLDELINKRKGHSSQEYILSADNKTDSHRLTYIPIGHDMVDDRLFSTEDRSEKIDRSGSINADFNIISDSNATLYLHDWFGYLKRLVEEYEVSKDKYTALLEAPIDISQYYQGSEEMGFSDIRDRPCRGELYEFTKTIKELAKGVGKSNNLRSNEETLSNHYKNYGETYGASVPEVFDFDNFLRESETEEMEEALQACKDTLKEISDLLTDCFRGIHHCLYDYFFGSQNQIRESLEIFGRAIHNNHVLLEKHDADIFRWEMLSEIKNTEQCLEVDNIDDMVNKIGDRNVFNFAVSKNLVQFSTAETVMILDDILQHAPYFQVRPEIFEIIKTVTFSEVVIESPLLYMDEVGLKKWYFSNYSTTTYVRTNAYQMWLQEKRTTIAEFDSRYTVIDDLRESSLVVIQGDVLDTSAENLRQKLQYGMNLADDALTGLTKIFDGINMLEQINSLFDLQKGDKMGGVLSLAGSSLNVFQKPLTSLLTQQRVSSLLKIAQARGKTYAAQTVKTVASKQAGKIIGSAGTALYAIEMGYVAFTRAGLNDDDAAALFGAASAFAIASLVVSFIPGLNVAVWVLMGVSLLFNILGTIFTDDHIDLFLKHCFWGKEFHSPPPEIPSWWINLSDRDSIEEGVITLDDTFEKIDTRRLEKDSPIRNSYRLLTMEENLNLVQKVIQTPSYEIGLGYETAFDNVQAAYIKIKIEKVDFSRIESIELRLKQASENRKGLSRIFSPKVDAGGMIELIPPKMIKPEEITSGLYKAPGLIGVNRSVTKLEDADSYEIIIIKSFREAQNQIAEYNSGYYGGESEEHYKRLSREEFKKLFSIDAEIVEAGDLDLSSNKVIEVMFHFNVPSMMPVCYRKGINNS